MNTGAPSLLVTVLPALISAIVAGGVAYLTLRSAVSRFYKERWFDRRIDAYTGAIHALHDMLVQDKADEKYLIEQHVYPPNEDGKRYVRYYECVAFIRKHEVLGTILFSEEASTELSRYCAAMDTHDEYSAPGEYEKVVIPAGERAIKALKKYAERDLNARES